MVGAPGLSVVEAEAATILFGLRLTYDAGYKYIEVEMDCLHLVLMLQGKRKEATRVQMRVNDIAAYVSSFYDCNSILILENVIKWHIQWLEPPSLLMRNFSGMMNPHQTFYPLF